MSTSTGTTMQAQQRGDDANKQQQQLIRNDAQRDGVSCQICKEPDTEEMVACDQCNEWYHFKCVGVDESIANKDWMCHKCSTLNDKRSTTSSARYRMAQLESAQILERRLQEEEAQLKKRRHEEEAELQRQRLADELEINALKLKILQLKERAKLSGSISESSIADSEEHKQEQVSKWVKESTPSALNNQQLKVTFPDKLEKIGNVIKTPADHQPVSMLNNASRNEIQNLDGGEQQLFNFTQLASRQAMSRDLPYFDGDPLEWPTFYANYVSSSRKCGYTNDENMVRLQKSLKGEARKRVRHLLAHPNTIPTVIDTLKMLYGRPDMIIENAMSDLRQHPRVRPDDLSSLIDYALLVQNTCALMELSNLNYHMSNPTIVQEMVDKLPAGIKIEWARESGLDSQYDMRAFSAWIMDYANYACKVAPSKIRSVKPSVEIRKYQGNQKGSFGHHSHVESKLPPRVKPNAPCKSSNNCEFCKEDHPISDCTKFLDLSKNKRWNFVIDNRLCRRCIKPHDFTRCHSRNKCGIDGCPRNHNPLLHTHKSTAVSTKEFEIPPSETVATTVSARKNVLFRILPVVLSNADKMIETYAFFDDGSSITLVDEGIAKALNATGPTSDLCLRWTNDQTRTEQNSKTIDIQISGIGGKTYGLSGVRTVKALHLPTQSVDMTTMGKEYQYLADLPIQSYERAAPRILIGIDNWKVGVPTKYREGKAGQPIAMKTRLGWAVSGPSTVGDVISGSPHFHICECNDDDNLHKMVKNYFSIDDIGIRVPEKTRESKENQRAIDILESTTTKIGDRYETGLLWREDDFKFPSSFHMAMKRLQCLEDKMKREPEFAEKLCSLINDYEKKGYARQLSTEELVESDRTWYLPVFTVRNINKPNKFRAVWDAAAKVCGTSLNDKLLKGPDQLASLVDILLRFRERSVGISGDIKEMYHQVLVRKEDRDAQRFLWRDGDSSRPPNTFIMNVMTFGAACSPASAQYVKNTNAAEHKDQYPNAFIAITTNHYVDDWLQSVDSEEQAIQLIREVSLVHSKGGFQIRNWRCNSFKVLGQIQSEDGQRLQELNVDDTSKVLGLVWSPKTDEFQFRIDYSRIEKDIVTMTRRPTKREILKIMMSIYDPLGLIASFLVYIKIILQEVWRSGVEWDEEIRERQYEKWRHWFEYLSEVEKVRIPRTHAITPLTQDIQMHVFVDGSESAYAAVVYYRIKTSDGIRVSLVGAKSKVTPLRSVSIPRIELQAALLGTRFAETIMNAKSITITSRHFWTDSETVIRWLQSDHLKYKQFVAHRLGEILETTNLNEWRWIGTKMNVADEATKWKTVPDLSSNSRWFKGPPFLYKPFDEWPISSIKNLPDPEEELKTSASHVLIQMPDNFSVTPKFHLFNNWCRLKRAQAYVIRAGNNFMSLLKKRKPRRLKLTGPLTSDELSRATKIILRVAQQESFFTEIRDLEISKCVKKKSSLFKFTPYLDENNLIRHNTRISTEFGVQLDKPHPIILPRNAIVTNLILMSYHVKYRHQNHETAMNEIRKMFLIPRLRSTFYSMRLKCQLCKILNAKPKVPIMAPLPPARLAYMTRPFSYTGIDLFGPMEVLIGRRVEKRWGVIYTCLTIRAVHIETVHSLSMNSCVLALRNFIGRRGLPLEIFTDNGTNFHGVDNEFGRLEALAGREEFSSIKWNFNPPVAPHMGGAWERLVRSIKNTLRMVMPSKRTTDEILQSSLIEIEMIVNSRPLTYIPVDPDEMEALTPNHFLLGSSNGVKPLGQFSDQARDLRNSYKTSQYISNLFWKRWLNEYLPCITRRHKWLTDVPEIKAGDVVIIFDANIQNSWRRGKIVDVCRGRDGKVRSAVVKTSSGTYTRPVASIAVLDVERADDKMV